MSKPSTPSKRLTRLTPKEHRVIKEAKRWYRKNGEWWIHHFGTKHPDPIVQLAVAVRSLIRVSAGE